MKCRLLAFFALVICADGIPAAESPEAEFRERVEILIRADSLPALVAKAKPTAVWNETDMLWVDEKAGHPPIFTLNPAHRMRDTASPQWALVRRRPGVEYVLELDEDFAYCRAEVVAVPPPRKDGPPPHALVMGSSRRHGTLYRIRWNSEPSGGNAHLYTIRDVFVLRAASGRWVFVATAPRSRTVAARRRVSG